jgi:hypothetical protein
MNCPVIRRRLLASESPDRPDADLQRHLDDCPACRAWQRRLAAVERQLPLLPAPPTTAKARLLEQIWSAAPPPLPRPLLPPVSPHAWRASPRDRARQKLALAFALAATLLVLALGFWAWPRPSAPTSSPAEAYYADLEAHRDRLLRAAATPRERVESLAALADRVCREANGLARTAEVERLDVLARFYDRLVREDLPAQARALSAQERPEVLEEVRRRLTWAESDVQRQLAEPRTPAAAAGPLQTIARAARDGHDRLGELLREAA